MKALRPLAFFVCRTRKPMSRWLHPDALSPTKRAEARVVSHDQHGTSKQKKRFRYAKKRW
jgi:hypothetical protein